MEPPLPLPQVVLPPDVGADFVYELVAWAQGLVLKHPAAAQAAYRALVAEGRRFVETPEGQAWQARVEASEAFRRFVPLWETATLGLLDATSTTALPTPYIDLLAQALSRTDLEALLARYSPGDFLASTRPMP